MRGESDALLLEHHVLSKAGHAALRDHWHARLAADADARATFERALAQLTGVAAVAGGVG